MGGDERDHGPVEPPSIGLVPDERSIPSIMLCSSPSSAGWARRLSSNLEDALGWTSTVISEPLESVVIVVVDSAYRCHRREFDPTDPISLGRATAWLSHPSINL
ncbi:MAG: hypothetical protein WBQ44_17535 [Rhodococcus sp. (in: high G+C Gram-positive bacteria)]